MNFQHTLPLDDTFSRRAPDAPRSLPTPNTVSITKSSASPGDAVTFTDRSRTRSGRIVSLGPKRAAVHTADGNFRVPYPMLRAAGPVTDHSARERAALKLAADLLRQHGLAGQGWTAALDDATRRAGACNYRKKTIFLTRLFVRAATEADVRDTILHEIAHALVGAQHHHDATWKAAARAIGCTANRCHTVNFSPPKWLVSCPNGCLRDVPRQSRRRRAVCRRCGERVTWTLWDGTAKAGA